MALYHKWDVKNDFPYVFQFFSLISEVLGGVSDMSLLILLVHHNISEVKLQLTKIFSSYHGVPEENLWDLNY